MPWEVGTHSLTKCCMWYDDENIRTYFSLDWKHTLSKTRDMDLGLRRLRNLIAKHGSRARAAIIYDMADGRELEHYVRGVKQNKPLLS